MTMPFSESAKSKADQTSIQNFANYHLGKSLIPGGKTAFKKTKKCRIFDKFPNVDK
jgi:hypothetical protein